MDITVLSLPACQQCKATTRQLTKKEIAHDYIDMSTDEASFELAKSLGYDAAPVVIVRKNDEIIDHWYGFRPDKLAGLN